ncbi:MAG: alpha/beta hydrolase [Cyanobacteria bacterium REEB67]|nr:alpha/beta hydrolase [Cyanobacteria bacterium REEB67]
MRLKFLSLAFFSLPLAYIALSPRLGRRLYRSLLFHPSPYDEDLEEDPPVVSGIKAEEFFFTTGSEYAPAEKLHAWYFKNSASIKGENAPRPKTILLSHGNSGNLVIRLSLIQLLLSCGVSVFVYDYRGFGKSSGKPSVEGICQDAVSAYDFLTGNETLGVSATEVVLYGESLGGALSSWLSGRRAVEGLILQSGFSSLKDIAARHVPFLGIYPDWLFGAEHLDSIRVVKGDHPPLLVIHGKLDQVVPYSHGELVYGAATRTKSMLTIGHAAHGDLVALAPQKMKEGIIVFLQSLPATAATTPADSELLTDPKSVFN